MIVEDAAKKPIQERGRAAGLLASAVKSDMGLLKMDVFVKNIDEVDGLKNGLIGLYIVTQMSD